MSEAEQDYWKRRAEQELTLAQDAVDERVIRAHYELLGLCLDQLYPDAFPEA